MQKVLTAGEIAESYKSGQKNFDDIKCCGDFHGFVLRGASFRKSDLSWSNFDTANLSGCDFTEANLMWSGVRRVDLRNAKFVRANVSYCDFDGSIFENTDFTDANLTASLLFNVNLGAANIRGANMTWTATHISQLDDAGLQLVLEQLKRMGRNIPPELLGHIELIVMKLHEKKKQLENLNLGYVQAAASDRGGAYDVRMKNLEKEISGMYNSLKTFYGKAVDYSMKGKKEKGHGVEYG
jgi:hypothetical protein